MTNYEKIKSMTAEEMTDALYDFLLQDGITSDVFCSCCINGDRCCDDNCYAGLLAWLNKEIDE